MRTIAWISGPNAPARAAGSPRPAHQTRSRLSASRGMLACRAERCQACALTTRSSPHDQSLTVCQARQPAALRPMPSQTPSLSRSVPLPHNWIITPDNALSEPPQLPSGHQHRRGQILGRFRPRRRTGASPLRDYGVRWRCRSRTVSATIRPRRTTHLRGACSRSASAGRSASSTTRSARAPRMSP